ncbi:MAG TPA: protein kinase, partial [Acidimicrobiales bacterium]|nr:protein kinase [Acidimicrobiales bacterium]
MSDPSPPAPSTPPTGRAGLVGTLLADRYRFERLIATGGMAQVWEATDLVLDRRVAVKLLHSHLAEDQSFVERFRREAIAAARLAHPAIVSIFDTYSGEGMEAIVMELVHGITLRQELDRTGALPPAEVVRIGAQVADALAVAHQTKLVHRDIKPANILLCDDDRVMVADFGIAKVDETTDHTKEGTMLGTAKYLAPEQVEGGKVDARTDVYALGVVLYEMLCGRPPFLGDSDAATALARLHSDPPRPRQVRADLPRSLDDIVMRALARQPDARFGTAAELRAALLAADLGVDAGAGAAAPEGDQTVAAAVPATSAPAASGSGAKTPAGGVPAYKPPRKKRRWVLPTLLLLLVAVALGIAGVLIGQTIGERLDDDEGGDNGTATADDGDDAAEALAITSVVPFDPEADQEENNDSAPAVVDGNPDTTWSSDRYNSPDFGNLKSGVGLVFALDGSVSVSALDVVSPSSGWAAQVYVSEAGGDSLEAWGEPVTTNDNVPGDVTFDLGDEQGRFV